MANPQTTDGYTKIANKIFDALCKIRIAGESRQMLDVIIRKTYGWNKPTDPISTSQFMTLTGLTYRAIYKARRKLKEMNIITISKKGDRQTLIYSFQKDYDKWKVSPKKETLSKKGLNSLQKRPKPSPKRCYTKDTNKRHYTKDILHNLRLKYVSLKDLNIKHFTSQEYARTGKALKDLLKGAGGNIKLVEEAMEWVAKRDYIDWTLETVSKKWADFMKYADQPELIKKFGGKNAI